MSKTLRGLSEPRVDIDQRSRAARLRLEQAQALLLPWVRPTRSWLREGLYWLCPWIGSRPTQESVRADSEIGSS